VEPVNSQTFVSGVVATLEQTWGQFGYAQSNPLNFLSRQSLREGYCFTYNGQHKEAATKGPRPVKAHAVLPVERLELCFF
jgi:hypothetical protein